MAHKNQVYQIQTQLKQKLTATEKENVHHTIRSTTSICGIICHLIG